MSSASNTFENKVLDAAFGSATLTKPTTIYVALYSTTPTDSSAGTELAGNNYSRQSVAFGSAANGVIASSGNVTFSATGNAWSTATGVALVDASTSGNIMVYKSLTPARTLQAGDTLTFESGTITITLD